MRLTYVSQHYPPEPAAAANRAKAFVDGLVARGHDVTVVCEQPNHPEGIFQAGYGHRPLLVEDRDGTRVHRLWVATSQVKTLRTRLAFYGTFAVAAAARVATLPRADVIIASSPPLPGPAAVLEAARARRTPFVLDVRDIWPAAAEALGELSDQRVVRFFESVERHLYRRSQAVTTTTLAFCRHVDAVAGRRVSVHVPNGASDEMISEPYEPPAENEPFTVGYVGNLGLAQGLDILPAAADLLRDERVRFLVVGGGPRRQHLESQVDRFGLTNVEIRPPVPREGVSSVLRSCHALLVCLRDEQLLDHFVPSKLFDAMAVGRPALLAARGESADLVRTAACGLVVDPEDGQALAEAIRTLASARPAAVAMGLRGRAAVPEFARSRQVERLEQILLEASR